MQGTGCSIKRRPRHFTIPSFHHSVLALLCPFIPSSVLHLTSCFDKPMVLRLTAGVLLSVVLVAGYGCRSKPARQATQIREEKVLQSCQKEKPASALPSGTGARIVTDISGSMKGFVLRGSVRLYTLHEILERATRDVLAPVEPQTRIERCTIGETLDCAKAPSVSAMKEASTYSARESRLDLFFTTSSSTSQPTDITSAPPREPIQQYRLSILVTDGMVARSPKATAAGPCLAGADPECIGHLLRQQVQQGYGVWISLLYLPFQGLHFAERPLDETHWERLRQHLTDLGRDPYFPNITFTARRVDSRVPFTTFHFSGVKPLLILLLSRDANLGRQWIVKFRDLVTKEPLAHPPQGIYTMELAPLALPTRQIHKFSIDPQGKLNRMRFVVAQRHSSEAFFDVLLECQRNGTGQFHLHWVETPPAPPAEVSTPLRWVWEPLEGTFPAEQIRLETTTQNLDRLEVTCPRLRAGHYEAWWGLRPQVEVRSSSDVFWVHLHADNPYEAPERFFGLQDIVQTTLQEAARQLPASDCLRLRVEYK